LTAATGHLNEAAAYLPPKSNASLADAYFRAGKAAYDAKEYGLADDQLKNAIDRGLNTQAVWFYRGAACYRQADWGLANSYFLKAYEIKPAAHLSACMGDSVLQNGDQVLAMAEYQGAIRDGYETLAVLNNLGAAYLLDGQGGGDKFEHAEACFSRAMDKAAEDDAPGNASVLLALYYNRATLEHRRAFNQKRRCGDLSKQEIRKAVALAPDRCLPRLLAADIYGLHASEGDADRQLAVDFMQDAIRLGAPASLTNNSRLRKELVAAVRDRPGGDALLAAQQRELAEPLPNRLNVLDDLLR
jgi:tetratricopeptide (TPR) repeat protein